jgi:hypothetical protein
MSTLTIEQRNAIYKEALAFYKDDIKDNDPTAGLCWAIVNGARNASLSMAVFNLSYEEYKPYNGGMVNYPELKDQCPEKFVGSYWWPMDNTAIRIKVLKKAIALTEPSNNDKAQ